ncbi:amino acid adenylation domain-containing protein [Nostoc sp. DedSLP04]|uniref:non-ribosomal peptide synthetase family protein n=1 Tax=Nostoc sp. DedSLP04 TaxID=3075401 RepID=UPI002AD4ACEE|nr:amino acid adenylation domain-containing protein [Nostoc sp. DedSLP04]MDZ8034015.1 amino acid adenylation domain-containing protein [Nostoc sp. DedSLP04]
MTEQLFVFPTSFAQQRLWFLHQLEANSSVYNLPYGLRISGNLKVEALQQAFEAIANRHEILRTTFTTVDGNPVQVIAKSRSIVIPVVNLSEWSEVDRAAQVQGLINKEAEYSFDLAHDSLLRVTLLQLGKNEYLLLLTLHHIIFDGWSIGVFIRELTALYKAFSTGTASPLPELPIQYADYAIWQREWLQGMVLQTHLDYWKQQLAGSIPVLELPTDRPRLAVQNFQGATESFLLSSDLSQALKHISQQAGVTLFMTLLAAFKTLLYRYTGEEDIIVGSPTANRNRPEIEGLIGFFVNTLVLRTYLGDNPSFWQLLLRVREVISGAFDHQDLPFEKLVEEMQPERSLSHTPLFQVMFVLQNAPMPPLELPELILNPVMVDSKTAKVDLSLSMTDTPQGLIGNLEYNTDLFEAATIKRMVGHFETMLSSIVVNPDQSLSDLPILTETELQTLLVKWNSTKTENLQDLCIHELFETQVEQTPDAVAVVFEGQQLTYRQLNAKANQLGRYLHSLGVRPEVLVGICVERSLEMAIALLGILKAGGAYVPLDPTYPQERLTWMLLDSRVPVLLTQKHLLVEREFDGLHIVCLDTDWEVISHESEENLLSGATPKNLAYIIYTSGSTGKPKGVMIQHQSLVNFTLAAIVEYGFTQSDGILQFASISFDTAVEEIYPCLISGGTLVLRNEQMLIDIPNFLKQCQEWEITVLDLPTAYWHHLTFELTTTKLRLPESLRLVIIGGEQVLPERVKMWQKYVGDYPQLFNGYGPTEATVVTTIYKLPKATFSSDSTLLGVPIGKPIRNVQVYVLDKNLQPVPIGIQGELYIGGAGLARGYLNRSDLTEEKFIPNFFNKSQESDRLYKTGDLVRYLPDGNIEFLGRIDNQVKVRGFRIELGEIEVVLAQHSEIKEVVVIAQQDATGNQYLVAYVVPTSKSVPNSSELRRFLSDKLPEYMLPKVFVVLEALPLTPNGKVDRKALPIADQNHYDDDTIYVAPRTLTEKKLTAIWSDLLVRKKVGINDNFFELGGHSLLLTQMIFRVRETFQVELPLRSLFQMPTVAGLAESIEMVQNTGSSNTIARKTVADLQAEAVLDRTIRPEAVPRDYTTEPASILLTGATGFLGAFLLDELLQKTPADIYCLVRSADAESGKNKLRQNLETYLLWNENFSSRIIPIVGDLSEPLFGLSQEKFLLLANKIDVIYHNGAFVNFIHPYEQMKAINVLGTQEVLRLASLIKIKPVHYVSTLSVFPAQSDSEVQVFREKDYLEHGEILESGYAQSKWVAEKLVAIALSRGLPVTIHRLGRITGNSKTGVWNTNDFMCSMIKCCIQLGSVPEITGLVDMTPVNYVSQAIVYLSQQKESIGEVFHLLNPHPIKLEELIKWVRSYGYPLRLVAYDKWRQELITAAKHSLDATLYSLLPLFPENRFKNQISIEESLSQSKMTQFDCQNTLDKLANTSIVCPAIDDELLQNYFSYFTHNGFVNHPHL